MLIGRHAHEEGHAHEEEGHAHEEEGRAHEDERLPHEEERYSCSSQTSCIYGGICTVLYDSYSYSVVLAIRFV